MSKDQSERYAKSAQKQREWFNGMSREERAEWERKQRAGIKRAQAGKRLPAAQSTEDNDGR